MDVNFNSSDYSKITKDFTNNAVQKRLANLDISVSHVVLTDQLNFIADILIPNERIQHGGNLVQFNNIKKTLENNIKSKQIL